MDDILDSLSKKGMKLKHRLRGKKHKPNRTGANAAGESAGSSTSFLRLEPHVVTGDRDGEGNRTSTNVQQDCSKDRSPHPDPVPAGGSDSNLQGREIDIDEKEVIQKHLCLDPNVKAVVDSGAGPEVGRVYLSPSTGEPDGT